jgi:hypothetical protein
MKHSSPSSLKRIFRATLLALGTLAAGSLLAGQPVIADPPMQSTKPSAQLEAEASNDMAVFIPASDNRDNSLPQPFKAGPVVFRPHVSYQFTSGTGLLTSPSNTVDSYVQTISPGFSVDFGRHWTLDYTPNIRIYSSRAFHNSVDHSASLGGRFSYDDWYFGLNQGFTKSDSLVVETGAQTEQENYATDFSAKHQLSEKFSIDLGVSQNISDVAQAVSTNGTGVAQSTRMWSTMDWLNYQVAKRVFFGVGVGVGYVDPDIGPGQLFEQVQGRIQWRATDKISFSVNAGFDERQYFAEGYGSALNPIYGASIQYAPFKRTQLSLSAGRTVSSSDFYISSQNNETTTVGISASQWVLEKFYLTGGASYSHTDYVSTFGPLGSLREDDNYSFNVSLTRAFLKRGNITLSYSYGDNQSTQTESILGFTVVNHNYTYRSSQISISAGFAY